MTLIDIVLMVTIIAGAVYIIYRSVWKKQGHCPGCDAGSCEVKSFKKGASCH